MLLTAKQSYNYITLGCIGKFGTSSKENQGIDSVSYKNFAHY